MQFLDKVCGKNNGLQSKTYASSSVNFRSWLVSKASSPSYKPVLPVAIRFSQAASLSLLESKSYYEERELTYIPPSQPAP